MAALGYFRAAAHHPQTSKVGSLEAAVCLRRLNSFVEARALLEALIQDDPGFVQARHQLGLLARQSGDVELAIEQFSAAIQIEPTNHWPLFEAASLQRELGRFPEADANFSELVIRAPTFAPGWHGRGLLARQMGKHEQALEYFRRAADVDGDYFWAFHDAGVELRALGRYNEAETAFRAAIGTNPDFAPARRQLGFIARDRGDSEAALAEFEAAARSEPDEKWNRLEVALSLADLGRLAEARGAFEALVAAEPDFPVARHRYGLLLGRNGDAEAALEQFRIGVDLAPGDPWPALELAATLSELGRLDEARAKLEQLVERAPAFAPARHALGLLLRRLGDREAALGAFRAAADADPDHVWARQESAIELKALGRRPEADAMFNAALSLDPGFANAWIELARMAREDGDRDLALRRVDAALAVAPRNVWILLERAALYRDAGQIERARADIDAALAIQPNFAQGHFALGLTLRAGGEPLASVRAFEQVLALEPENMWARLEMAENLLQAGRRDEAVASLEALVAERPEFARATHRLGQVRRDDADWQSALSLFEGAFLRDPRNPWVARDYCDALARFGRSAEATAIMTDMVANAPGSAEALIGWVEVTRRGRSPAAIAADLERASALEPGNRHAQFVLADEYLRQGRLEEADAVHAQVLAIEPDNPYALAGRGHVARASGRAGEALRWFAAAAEFGERIGWDGGSLELSREQALAGRWPEAEAALNSLLSRSPGSIHARMQRVQNARLMGDFVAARAELATLSLERPHQPLLWVELAHEEIRLGRSQEAMGMLTRALALRPGFAAAYDALASLAQQSDDIETSVECLKRSAALDVTALWPRIRLAQFEAMLGHGDLALASLATLQREYPSNPEIALTRAQVLRELGQYFEAWSELEGTARVFPHSFDTRLQRARLAIELGYFEVAAQALADAKDRPAVERARLEILAGQLAEAQWESSAALAHFDAALAYNPNDAAAASAGAMVALRELDIAAADRLNKIHARNDATHLTMMRGIARPSQTHHGQLLTDFRLDPEALERIAAAKASQTPLASLAQVVRDFPDSTPAALSLLIALRRAGRFPGPGSATGNRVPNRLGQFWNADPPSDVQAFCQSFRDRNPRLEYIRFDLGSARDFLRAHYPVSVLRAFDLVREPAGKADLFRLAWLAEGGGYWADADDFCLAPLSNIVSGERGLALYQECYGTSGNNFIAAAPRHSVMTRALDLGVEATLRGDRDGVWLSTGPGLLTRVLACWLADDLTRAGEIEFLERWQLTPVIAIHCLASYKFSERHWSRATTSNRKQREKMRAEWNIFLKDPAPAE